MRSKTAYCGGSIRIEINDGKVVLHKRDSREVLAEMPDNSIDSCVTDPPYALVSISKRFGKAGAAPAQFGKDGAFARQSRGFMGKTWDNGDVAHDPAFWSEVLRVLKPGGHVLAFAGTRTYHRLVCAIEDAGFEIRDQIQWLYGSGFPKSHNQHGEWEGWGSALKPANEPIVMARKPLDGTIEANLGKWRTGALNIDGCRVGGEPWKAHRATGLGSVKFFTEGEASVIDKAPHDLGRWPANLIHDGSEEVLAAFPDAKGQQGNVSGTEPSGVTNGIRSAARFFYCAKASKKDRDEGLEAFEKRLIPSALARVSQLQGEEATCISNTKNPRANTHPTVKPTDLMRYLCRLVTPPGGVVLDPFMGSGSTGKAAMLEEFRFVGVDMEAEYFAIAEARIVAALRSATEPVPANDNVRKPDPDNDLVDWIEAQGDVA